MKRQMKTLTAALLSLILIAAVLPPLPARAAESAAVASFTDIPDEETAVAVEALRIMGVVDGMSSTTFWPRGSLTRAQFCKMAVLALSKGDLVARYKNYTIFPDVRASHWAAGYINLALRNDPQLISGYPDGEFKPESTITYGQAVSILMRMLGYTDADVGVVWPDGYLTVADSIGLTEGISLGGYDPIPRGDAAKLFMNLMNTETKGEIAFSSSIAASTVPNTVLLSCSAVASDGTGGSMLTADGKTYKMAGKSGTGLLSGRTGTLLLDKGGKVITFVPKASLNSKTITVSLASAVQLTDSAGAKYEISTGTTAYINGESSTYGALYPSLRSGASVTLYFDTDGSVSYLFSGTEASANAVIVLENGSTAGFSSLTGGMTGYSIYKNGIKASSADMRKYDVATFSSATNSIRVSDSKLVGRYENASPNASAPETVTVMGHVFEVLPSARASCADFALGSQVTLLLTEDNKVASMAAPTAASGSNAVGIVTSLSGGSVTVRLLGGLTLSGETAASADLLGQLVSVYSPERGKLSLSRLASSGAGAGSDFDVAGKTLGGAPLADNVAVYETAGGSALRPMSLSELEISKVPAAKIAYVGKDWAGRVSILVLGNVTGDCFTYGLVSSYTEGGSSGSIDDGTLAHYGNSVTLAYGNGQTLGPIATNFDFRVNAFAGIATTPDGSGIAQQAVLKKLAGVSNGAWNGNLSVTVDGATYTVAEDVVCYNRTAGVFMSLSAAKAQAGSANLYCDGAGNRIRIVEVS